MKKSEYAAISSDLKEKFGYKNALQAPHLLKIVLNIGLGRKSAMGNFEDKILPEIIKEFSTITGQKPAVTKSKKSIAGFKLRAGQIVGIKATLRRERMYDFLRKLDNIVFPRLRDFRGIDLKSIDKSGVLNIGLKEQVVFPEINPETSSVDFGLEISIVSSAKKRDEAVALYRALGIPLKKS